MIYACFADQLIFISFEYYSEKHKILLLLLIFEILVRSLEKKTN